MVYITRREYFNAAHRLFRPDWSDEKNNEVFGKCANPNWHGHNYTLFVTVKGNPDPATGYFLNLKDLGQLIKAEITDKIDHKNLNLEVDFMKGIIPSTENVAMAVWKQLQPHIKKMGGALHAVRLHETENNFVEYFGD